MAFQGDLKTFPVPDLLSWLEGARKPGRLTLSYGAGERVLYLGIASAERFGAPGLYERLARMLRLSALLDLQAAHSAVEQARGGMSAEQAFTSVGVPEQALLELARDDAWQAVADLFKEVAGTFHFSEDLEGGDDETIGIGLSLRELLYEGARRVDEAKAAEKAIGDDALVRLGAGGDGKPGGLAAAAVAVVASTPQATVGAVRLALGISRGGAARILNELWRRGHLAIEGARSSEAGSDPLSRLLRQGEQLLSAGHFEAAALVFNNLLASDPSDPRVREFARAVEREHVDAIYRKLSPVAVPRMAPNASITALRPDERIVASLVNGSWDVSTLVLASPLRELQTLRAIERMVELGFAKMR